MTDPVALARDAEYVLSDLIENDEYEIPAFVRTCLRGVRQNVRALRLRAQTVGVTERAAIIEQCAAVALSVVAARYAEKSEDFQIGFDRGGNAASRAILEMINPQQACAAERAPAAVTEFPLTEADKEIGAGGGI